MAWKDIKVVALDVDGTLTNNLYQIDSKGEVTKSFHTRDFWAIQQWFESGIKVVIITQSHDDVMMAQLKRIGSHSTSWDDALKTGKLLLMYGVDDKKASLQTYCAHNGYRIDTEVLFIGDAENDLEAMKSCALTACPADAIKDVIEESNYPATAQGGHGAVREAYEYYLKMIGQEQ